MSKNTLEAYVEQIKSLDTKRNEIAFAAFELLSRTDRELWQLVIDAFESKENAALWMADNNRTLGDMIPIELLLNGEREAIINYLLQIEYGVYT